MAFLPGPGDTAPSLAGFRDSPSWWGQYPGVLSSFSFNPVQGGLSAPARPPTDARVPGTNDDNSTGHDPGLAGHLLN